jgi:hypothetical protein
MIEMLDADEEEADHGPTTNEPTISISALTGIHPRKGRTMQVFVTIYDMVLRALLDSGSTHNFVDSEVAARVGIVFSSHAGLSVAVANGDRLESAGSCTNLKILIAGDAFTIDCYGLSLGSYDMVLGVQWLESLGGLVGLQEPHTVVQTERAHGVLVGVRTARTTETGDRGRIWRRHGRATPSFHAPLRRADRAAPSSAALSPDTAAARHTPGGSSSIQVHASSEAGIRDTMCRDVAPGGHPDQLLRVRCTSAPCQEKQRVMAVLR